jgi:hypothetical protein
MLKYSIYLLASLCLSMGKSSLVVVNVSFIIVHFHHLFFWILERQIMCMYARVFICYKWVNFHWSLSIFFIILYFHHLLFGLLLERQIMSMHVCSLL